MADNAIKKGDIVRIDYEAYIADINRLYDTSSEEKAKSAGIYDEKYEYAPMPYIVGSGRLFPAIDEALQEAEIGRESTVDIACADAAGPRDPRLIETYPAKDFARKDIAPYPGLRVQLGERSGTVISAGAGRVKVDFNNPLAGKDLSYTFTPVEVVTDPVEKAKAVVQIDFGSSEGFSFDIGEDKVSLTLPDAVKFSEDWAVRKFRVVADIRDVFGVGTVELTEVWSKAPAAEAGDAKAEEEA